MTERTGVKWMLRDSEETCLLKDKFRSSMTPIVLIIPENRMGVPAIVSENYFKN